ncbi:MAG: glutamate--tRNA ligase [Clostridia bacterium]|nr:glutamate--tRNA ligase [Clostridia bacterium]
MDYTKLAELLYPDVTKTPEDIEALYPARELPEGAKVTRFAPSPTGYMHIGNMFSALIDLLAARSSGGVFYLRIEDTDRKREVSDAVPVILDGLRTFGIVPDEGVVAAGERKGSYGPYVQSERAEIYRVCAKALVAKGAAYPCFCTPEELSAIRSEQEAAGENTGYYGKYARCRDLSLEDVKAKLDAGMPFVIRLRAEAGGGKIVVDDMIKGKLELPENDVDVVLMKSDGIPPYAFAHAVDDHYMRTTHVIRGDEWVSSLPAHIAIFRALGFKPPKYAHISPIMKLDGGNKRKLSKRKDPEAGVSYYMSKGYPKQGVLDYLCGIANSDFEDWRRANPDESIEKFKFNFKKMSSSGALFDTAKLDDVSKGVVARMTADEVLDSVLEWSRANDAELFALLDGDRDRARAIFSIDRGGKKGRKDIAKWEDVRGYVSYFYDALFEGSSTPENVRPGDAAAILARYAELYDPADDRDAWFAKIKTLCADTGFCADMKAYRADPGAYPGSIADVTNVIRAAVTGRTASPDLYDILRLLGDGAVERMRGRCAQ